MSSGAIKFGRHSIGAGHPCFVIAEAGVNHNGDLVLARQLIDVAANAGADAVKFQTFKASRLVTAEAPKADYQKKGSGGGGSQLEMLERLELTREMHLDLMAHCRSRDIEFLSSPFEESSVDLLVELGLQILKIPSGEITNVPFLEHVARKDIPVILSTGMASLSEVREAVEIFGAAKDRNLVLLHCISSYPAPPEDSNLRAMNTMRAAFRVPVGYSDHTAGTEVALAAVALGACVIEKHITLDRSLPGPDHQASLEPAELECLVKGIRKVESALGHDRKEPVLSERNAADVARKSIVANCDIPAGCIITAEMLAMKRPGTGLPSAMAVRITGRRTRTAISAGTLISLEMLA